jgi:hypothetical protein
MAELIGEVAASRRGTIAAVAQHAKPAPATSKQPSVATRAATASSSGSSATAAD